MDHGRLQSPCHARGIVEFRSVAPALGISRCGGHGYRFSHRRLPRGAPAAAGAEDQRYQAGLGRRLTLWDYVRATITADRATARAPGILAQVDVAEMEAERVHGAAQM